MDYVCTGEYVCFCVQRESSVWINHSVLNTAKLMKYHDVLYYILWVFSEHLFKQGTIFYSTGYKKIIKFHLRRKWKVKNHKIVVVTATRNTSKTYWAFVMFKILGERYIKLYKFSLIFTNHLTDEDIKVQRSLKNLPKSLILNRTEF